MEKVFMLDIETTGLDKEKDEILEIAVLECKWHNGYYLPCRHLDLFLPSNRVPENDFAKEHMTWLYQYANKLLKEGGGGYYIPGFIRKKLLDFFKECGAEKPMDRTIVGWNVTNFDLDFLAIKGMLKKEDYSYRIYEMSGLNHGMMDAMRLTQEKRNRFFELVKSYDQLVDCPTIRDMPKELDRLPENLSHWGLFDNFSQIKLLNGYLKLIRNGTDTIKDLI